MFIHCFGSLIQQTQKFFMETKDISDERDVCHSYITLSHDYASLFSKSFRIEVSDATDVHCILTYEEP